MLIITTNKQKKAITTKKTTTAQAKTAKSKKREATDVNKHKHMWRHSIPTMLLFRKGFLFDTIEVIEQSFDTLD